MLVAFNAVWLSVEWVFNLVNKCKHGHIMLHFKVLIRLVRVDMETLHGESFGFMTS